MGNICGKTNFRYATLIFVMSFNRRLLEGSFVDWRMDFMWGDWVGTPRVCLNQQGTTSSNLKSPYNQLSRLLKELILCSWCDSVCDSRYTLSDSLELQNKVIKGFESYLLLTFSSNSIQSSLIGNPSAPGCEQKFFQTQICWKRTMPASPPQLASLKYGEVPSKCFSFPYM